MDYEALPLTPNISLSLSHAALDAFLLPIFTVRGHVVLQSFLRSLGLSILEHSREREKPSDKHDHAVSAQQGSSGTLEH
jgi:hypothetical protein